MKNKAKENAKGPQQQCKDHMEPLKCMKRCTVTKQSVQTQSLRADSLEAACCDVRQVKVYGSRALRGIGAECADHRTDNSHRLCFWRTDRDIDSIQKSPARLPFLPPSAAHVMSK